MFTLGDKIRVENSDANVVIIDNTNTVVATAAAVANTDKITVGGFGSFAVSDITNIKLRRAVPAVGEAADFKVVAPAGMQVGDAVEVVVSLATTRYQAEVLTQSVLGGGRTMSFSTAKLSAIGATDIATAIIAGYDAHKKLYHNGDFFFDVAAGTAGDDIGTSVLAGKESITVKRVELKRVQQGVADSGFLSLAKTTNVVGTEGAGQGKFLEESVRMSNARNTDPYGVDTATTQVDIRGNYTEVSFTASGGYDENIALSAADAGKINGVTPASQNFTLFLNEVNSIAANQAIAKLAAVAVLRGVAEPAVSNTLLAPVLTAAEEEAASLIIANGGSTNTVDLFITNDATGQV